jgi:hypothetical protein
LPSLGVVVVVAAAVVAGMLVSLSEPPSLSLEEDILDIVQEVVMVQESVGDIFVVMRCKTKSAPIACHT